MEVPHLQNLRFCEDAPVFKVPSGTFYTGGVEGFRPSSTAPGGDDDGPRAIRPPPTAALGSGGRRLILERLGLGRVENFEIPKLIQGQARS